MCIFSSTFLCAQELQGIITDINSKPISDCYIILTNANNNETIDYVIPNNKGKYKILINNSIAKNVVIKCQGTGYIPQMKNIKIKTNEKVYEVDFLLDYKINVLDDIIVILEKVALKIKNDTVEYDVSKFKRFDDRKIINVLKNMPGIQVDEKTGIIQYKGRPIETLLLDGDDLFGKGYSVGARNISSDLVDKVEAIEDYHNNRLKKGLKKSDDVVLNLKFKKGKFKVAGEASIGGGKDSHLVNANIINLSSNNKGFGVLNVNNISINQTPFNKDTYVSENREEVDNSSIDFFNESSVTQTSIFPRSFINNLKFGTFNNLFKISDKIKLKTSISFFNDINQYSFISRNDIRINDNSIKTSNETFNINEPVHVSITNDFNFDLSKTAILKFSNRFNNYKNIFQQNNLQNKESIFQTQINQSKFYYQQNINFTKRITNNDLIEFNFFNSNDTRKQTIAIVNQQDVIYNSIIFNNLDFNNNREIFLSKISYLKKTNKWNFEVTAKHLLDREDFTINNNPNTYYYQFKNNISNLITTTNFEKNKKFRLTCKLDLGYSSRKLLKKIYNETIKKDDAFVNADVKMKLKLNDKSNLTLNFENENKLNDNYYLLSNPVLIDSRTIINSNTTLNFQKKWKSYLNFSHFNLFKQSSFTFLSSYEEIQNSIVAEQNINEDINIITYFQTPQSRKDINLSISKTFFVDAINNKISMNSNSNFSRYFNALNGNDLNIIWSSIYNFNIEINSAFKGFFNYKSSIGLTYIENKQKNNNPFINKTINAKFETIFNLTKKTYFKMENELLLPKGSDFNRNQLFIDFSLNNRGKNIKYFILSRNLLNNESFNQVYVSEFSTSIFSNNLFKRYVVFGLNYNF
jgi:hypothetical protein